MTDINSVILIGNLVKDCEAKASASGYSVVKFSIAVNKCKKTGDKFEDYVNYFDVNLWGKSGDSLKSYLLKGQKVCVQGELKQERWEKDGQKFSKIVVEAEKIELLNKKEAIAPSSAPSSSVTADDFEASFGCDSVVPF